jgi:hypothetical protein
MKLTALALFWSAGVLSVNAFGQISCERLFRDNTFFRITGFENKDTRLIAHTLNGVDKLLNFLNKPKTWVRQDVTNYLFSQYTLENDLIRFTFPKRKEYRLKSAAVVAHEYGHAYFEHNIQIPLNGKIQTIAKTQAEVTAAKNKIKTSTEYQSLKKTLLEIQRVSPGSNALPVILKKLSDYETTEMEKQFEPGIEKKLRTLDDLYSPHNELFADLVAALYANNGAAIANALGFPYMAPYLSQNEQDSGSTEYRKNHPNLPRPRDFTQKIEIENFVADKGLEPYTILDPVRSILWEKYVLKSSAQDYPKIINAYLRAVETHVQILLERGDQNKTSTESFNREFLKLFEEQMKKGSLPRAP